MHNLGRAALVLGSETPAGDGVTGVLRCVISDANGKRFAAYLKCGPLEEVMSEALASLLLSGWGLSVPAPYLVQRGDDLCFASADVSYPNLKKRLNIDALPPSSKKVVLEHAFRLICSFKSTPLAAACDEAVYNFDRNIGNVLWDGAQEVWIDHAFCFGVGSQPDANKLCTMAVAVGETEQMQRSSLAAALTLDRTGPGKAQDQLAEAPFDVSAMIDLVERRLQQIGQLMLARFPQPADLLSKL